MGKLLYKKFFILTISTLLVVSNVKSAPPENADPALAPFYKSLMIPGAEHISCCSENDCRPVKTRMYDGKLQMFADSKIYKDGNNQWVDIPQHRVLTPRENPTGEPVACWDNLNGVICFVNGPGT